MYHAIFTGFPSAEATNVQIQGFFPVEKIILRVDWELKKSGYQKSEPISVHFCEVYQSHIRWWGYRKTDPEQQKTVPTPKGYKNLTFTPGLLQLFMVYGGCDGNYQGYAKFDDIFAFVETIFFSQNIPIRTYTSIEVAMPQRCGSRKTEKTARWPFFLAF